VSDGALVALGTVLTVVPGLVTSALGLLLLLPPTRAAARPVVTALAARSLVRMPLIVTSVGGAGAQGPRDGYRPTHGDYIDGEVIDVTDVEPPSLPKHPDVA
jgi:UPF0716 protein FxsA